MSNDLPGQNISADAGADAGTSANAGGNGRGGDSESPSLALPPKIGEFSMLAVKAHDASCGDVGGSGKGVGKLLVQAAEAHCRANGCTLMQLGILCPDVAIIDEPDYKKWLQQW